MVFTIEPGVYIPEEKLGVRMECVFLVGEDGKLVELPPDMSYQEAVKLVSEGQAAMKRIGKGPQPKPVEDVKKLDKREPPAKPKAAGKGGKGSRSKGRASAKAGASAAAMLKAVGTSKVAQYLANKAVPVMAKGLGKLQKLRQNEQTHDDAAEKRAQAEQAVVIPPSDGQSKSNAVQVGDVSQRRPPAVDAQTGKETLQQTLEENVPRSIEDVDNFKGSIAILKRVTGVAAGDHTVKLQWKVVGAMASAKILITSGFEHASLRVTEQPSVENDADDNITAFQVMVLRLPQQSTG